MKDYFNILGVAQNAPDDEIKRAYRSLAMKHHPDRGGDQNKFQEIQEAYGVLSDPQKKAEWIAQSHGNPFGGQPHGFHFNFGGPGGSPFDEIFRQFHGSPYGGQPHQAPKRNRDLKVNVDLELASTLEGQQKHISVTKLNGAAKTVTIDIPRGVNGNMQMKYAGHGDHSQPDVSPGDLYISFRILRHPDFEIDGIDLIKSIRLNCLDAITGTTIKIKTLEGKELEWNVPAGTQNNAKFRLGPYGLWNIDHPVRGNLIGHIQLTVPTNLTTEQLIAIENLSKQLNQGNNQ